MWLFIISTWIGSLLIFWWVGSDVWRVLRERRAARTLQQQIQLDRDADAVIAWVTNDTDVKEDCGY